ncbi:MAG: hypothetical protein ACKPKO_11055, partial [Candidatus Fonsibacter sp.]
SLDRGMPADIRTDIMDWDYTTYSPHEFKVVWASPPCTEYNMAKTTGVRKRRIGYRNGPYILFDTLIRSIGSSRNRIPENPNNKSS